jgi:DNA segregation ATPase FtsK/SpoIIIE, S-DNA-T family
LIDMLERRGIISGYEGSKPRTVLVSEADVPRILAHLAEATGGPAGDPPAPAAPSSPTLEDVPANGDSPYPMPESRG